MDLRVIAITGEIAYTPARPPVRGVRCFPDFSPVTRRAARRNNWTHTK